MPQRTSVSVLLSIDTEIEIPFTLPLMPGSQICFLTPRGPLNGIPRFPFFFKRSTGGFVDIFMPKSMFATISEIRGTGVKNIEVVTNIPNKRKSNQAIPLGIKAQATLNITDLPGKKSATIKISIKEDNVREYHGIEVKFPQGSDFVKRIICEKTSHIKLWEKFKESCKHRNMNHVSGYYDLYDCPDCGYCEAY